MLLVSFSDVYSPDVPGLIIDGVSNVKAGDIYTCYKMGIPCYFLVYDNSVNDAMLCVPERIRSVVTGSETEIRVFLHDDDATPTYSGITSDFLHWYSAG